MRNVLSTCMIFGAATFALACPVQAQVILRAPGVSIEAGPRVEERRMEERRGGPREREVVREDERRREDRRDDRRVAEPYWRQHREADRDMEWRRRAEFREAEHRRADWIRDHCVRDWNGRDFCRR